MSTESVYTEQPEATKAAAACERRKPLRFLPKLQNNRVLLTAAAVAAIGGGCVLNWGWLVTAGLAPIIVSLLPCIAMCALGIGVCKMAGNKTADPQLRLDGSTTERAADLAEAPTNTNARERNAS